MYVLTGVLMALWVLAAVPAVAAIRTGWLLPWLRRRTHRPRMWGYATLLGNTGACLVLYGFVVDGRFASDLLFGAGILLVVTGAVLEFRTSRPRGR
ncbi:hypothetical protein ACFS5L_26825 [Streptomyces phyllanthi]|uniref:PQ-loop repeat-containing protein n=1 Tax=Streptomyces phyllanthi TaxID=1803180 RepID=A0A5N8W4X8_9ACTN|nr:hypothetical protein [Streptomyces phyllanthi]MPY41398.1 hypothetical protein [Streptomyces phyllanthi]